MKFLLRFFFLSFLGAFPCFASQNSDPYPVVILGGGVGALTSAIYLGRAGLSPLVITGDLPGGLLTQSQAVQNWPGELEIDGFTLTAKMQKHAEASGAKFINAEVVGVDFSKKPFTIRVKFLEGKGKEEELLTESCIIAMGAKPNFLKIPGEEFYWGRGVSNCVTCDGALFKNRRVGVVGGGDAAVLEALHLADIAKEVFVFVRGDHFRANEEVRLESLIQRPNVKILYGAKVESIGGTKEALTHVMVKKGKEKPFQVDLDGLFLAIGSRPNTDLFQKALTLDDKGYIQLAHDQETKIPGVYAIGDIVDPVYKQAISAAGDGAKAALQAQKYLSNIPLIAKAKKAPISSSSLKDFGEVIEVTSLDQFQKEVKTSTVPVVVDFYAPWCGPCSRLSPLLESSANHLNGRAKFLKVNVDKFYDLSAAYQIRSMPTVVVLDSSGLVLDKKTGAHQITDLLKKLESEEFLKSRSTF